VAVTLAVAAGIGSALAYGAGTAGQHAAAYTGEVDAGRLADLLRNPRWLLATVGDLLGAGLQIVALSNGAVVLVQPLLVLSLPVAVVLRSWFGAPPPTRRDLGNCLLLIAALSLFFVLLGEPRRGRIIDTTAAAWTTTAAMALGALAITAVRQRPPVPRVIVFGVVAGSWFGVVSVLIEAVTKVWGSEGLDGFDGATGLVPLVGVIALSVAAYLLVQIGFQLGPLGASFPPNLILNPVVAVVLGALLLGEHVSLSGVRIPGYLACLAVAAWATVRLAAAPLPG
jgi:hypothetical protein